MLTRERTINKLFRNNHIGQRPYCKQTILFGYIGSSAFDKCVIFI